MNGPLHLDLYGDVLEAVVSRVPTVDLIPASRVSREWRSAVRSSLRRHPRRSPWLLLRHLRRPGASPASFHAFDPFSSSWLALPPDSPSPAKADVARAMFLRGSAGDRLHTLTVSKIAISQDPFGTAWGTELKAPKVWRQDAVVAEVGRWLVVAGGGCPMVLDEGEVVGAVEVCDRRSGAWESAEPMPPQFDGSTCATWLSVAPTDERLYVMEKKTGLLSCFDPESKRWGSTWQPRPDPGVQCWAVAMGRREYEAVLVVGVGPASQSGTKVRLVEVGGSRAEEEMPREMAERLFPREEEGEEGAWERSWAVEVCGTERGGYVYNPAEIGNGAALYEFAEERGRIVGRWEWVPLPEAVGEGAVGRVELGCSAVGLEQLASLCTK